MAHAETEARKSGVFGEITLEDGPDGPALVCEATDAGAPAHYSIRHENGTTFIGLETRDRWLSESIEADVMHTGDSLEELIEEELVDRDLAVTGVTVQHYRDEGMCYVFRSPLPDAADERETALWLLAYEAAFRELGDMNDVEA